MFGEEKVHIKCIIQSVDSDVPRFEPAALTEERSVLLGLFLSKIRAQYEFSGELTVWRSRTDRAGKAIRGQEINEKRFELAENETIFVMYNEKVPTIPGGAATGAAGRGLAKGGVGTGARITKEGVKIGGDGFGGDLIGRKPIGTAGEGWGGQVKDGRAGGGVGGDIIIRDPKSKDT